MITNDEGKINELFVRLNKGKPLTGAEVRNAMGGKVPALIREIAQHQFFELKVRFSKQRRQNDNVAAKLLLFEFRGQLVETKKVSLDRFVQESVNAAAAVGDFVSAAKRVLKILERMNRVFADRDPLLKSQGPISVYYWFFRHVSVSDMGRAHEFLERFEVEREQNRLQTKVANANVDSELIRYDNFDRNTNDQGSLEGRFEILTRRFEKF